MVLHLHSSITPRMIQLWQLQYLLRHKLIIKWLLLTQVAAVQKLHNSSMKFWISTPKTSHGN